ncbi:ARM repeat superfamily protein isoform X2 [Tasmannia lanceolata]|uniref:ARM repeat superfamily protein isoform X2 n=1 Tax=Tasmannia lanceolata TaxID=3420 RepID=UPI004063A781
MQNDGELTKISSNRPAHCFHAQTAFFALKNPSPNDSTIHTLLNSLSLSLQNNSDSLLLSQTLTLIQNLILLQKHLSPLILDTICFHLPHWIHTSPSLSLQALTLLVSISNSSWTLGDDLILSLLSTSNASVLSRLLNLLAQFDSNSAMSRCDFMFRVFLGFTNDPYPYVRRAALEGLIAVINTTTGFVEKKMEGCYVRAIELLVDHDELVRLSAVRVIGEWGHMLGNANPDVYNQGHLDAVFVRLCSMARDMSMVIRVEAFLSLGKVRQVSEDILLQTLSKKILGITKNRKSLHKCPPKEFISLISSASGAFVHGLEDEFYEVRRAACNSLGMLTIFSTKFADGSLHLLMDILNDDTTVVRLKTLNTMFYMASYDLLRVQESHMHTFLNVLVDIDPLIRCAARKLLQVMKLPDVEMFKSSINGLLTNLETYPEDEVEIFCVLYHIGKNHVDFSAIFMKGFAQEIKPSCEGELGLDRPQMAALLVLAIASPFSNDQLMCNIPDRVFSYALPLLGRICCSLGEVINKDPLLAYLCHCKRPMPFPAATANIKEDEHFLHVVGGGNLNCTKDKRICRIHSSMQEISEDTSELEFPNNLVGPRQVSTVLKHQQKVAFLPKEVICAVNHILVVVVGTWPSIKSGYTNEVLRTLRYCKEELSMITVPSDGSVGVLAFAFRYIKVIQLLTEIWEHLQPRKLRVAGIEVLDIIFEKLDTNLRSMRYRFLGLSNEEEFHVLQLILLSCVFRLSNVGICCYPPTLKRLHATMSRLEFLCQEGSAELSDFAKELKSFFQGNINDASYQFPGLPVGITFQITLYNISSKDRVWLQMAVGELIEHDFLDLNRFGGCDEVRKCVIDVPFYRTPKAASFSLRAYVGIECPFEDVIHPSKGQGGPKRELTYLCKEKEVYLSAMKNTVVW